MARQHDMLVNITPYSFVQLARALNQRKQFALNVVSQSDLELVMKTPNEFITVTLNADGTYVAQVRTNLGSPYGEGA